MHLAHILDHYYPERIRVVYLIGAPAVFQLVWSMVRCGVIGRRASRADLCAVLCATTFARSSSTSFRKTPSARSKCSGPGSKRCGTACAPGTGGQRSARKRRVAELQTQIPLARIPAYLGGPGPDHQVLVGGLVAKATFAKFSRTWTRAFVFGLVSDVQHVDLDDGPNFKGTRVRRYRQALHRGLRRAVDDWLLHDVEVCVQLGDVIDGQAKRVGDSRAALERVNEQFARLRVPIHHLVGNHEL
jgi:hypothetical protein